MRIRLAVLILLVLVAMTFAVLPGIAKPVTVPAAKPAAPLVFASPINGGCYIAAPNQCRLHVDPFTVNIASGKRLESLQLQANGKTVYDFRTDISNPPPSIGTTYTPSLVAQDFAATCGVTYTLNIVGKDSGDTNPLNMGLTGPFVCPTSVP
jgi:hypothetical protein